MPSLTHSRTAGPEYDKASKKFSGDCLTVFSEAEHDDDILTFKNAVKSTNDSNRLFPPIVLCKVTPESSPRLAAPVVF